MTTIDKTVAEHRAAMRPFTANAEEQRAMFASVLTNAAAYVDAVRASELSTADLHRMLAPSEELLDVLERLRDELARGTALLRESIGALS